MYDNTSIEALVKRVGWNMAVPPTSLAVTSDNNESLSGRYFNAFNPLVTVESVDAGIINKDSNNDEVNALMAQIRYDGVMQVLSDVYNLNTRATRKINNGVTSINYLTDYSGVIISKQQYFDEAIGYAVAVKTLQLLIATPRSNRSVDSAKFDYNKLMQYLEGSFTSEGKLISPGLLAKYEETIGKLIEVLFPLDYPDGYIIDPNGNVRVPTLRARRIW